MTTFNLCAIPTRNSRRTQFAVPALFMLLMISTFSAAQSGIALVQSNAVSGSSVTSISQSFPRANTAGNLIVAFVRASTTTQTVSMNDTAGNHYLSAVSQAQSTDGHQVQIFYAANVAGGSNTVTAKFSGTNIAPWIAIYEYSGVSKTNPLVQTAAAQGSSSTAKSNSITVAPGNLLFAGVGVPRSYTGSITNGPTYTLLQQAASRGANQNLSVVATGSATSSLLLGASTNWTNIAAVFAPASPGSTTTTNVVGASLTPTSATLQVKGTQQFAASITGNTNTAVTWSVNGATGGNTTAGTISTNGLYTAPATAPASAVTVTATSVADTTKSASASVSVTATPTTVSVSISPTSASLTTGKTQQFASAITGTTNTAATWQVNGVTGGNSTVGYVSTSGLYTAPSTAPGSAVAVKATSSYDSSKSASASVSVTAASTPPPTSSGPAYYVSPSGSDSNSGTASSPFLTIQHAGNVATAGYTVHVAPGTYPISLIDTSNNGTASAPIVFISDQQWGAKIVVSSAVNGNGWANTGSYVEIIGFDISASDTSTNQLMHMEGSHDQALGNRVHDMAAPSGSCPSGGAIQLGGGVNYHTAIGNMVFNNGPAPSALCNQTQGIYINTSYNVVENNVIFNNGGMGIQIWGPGSTANVVTNNTVFGNLRGMVIGSETSTPAAGNIIANNIFYNNLQQGIYDESGTTGTNTLTNNLFYGNSPNTSLTTDTAVNTISTAPKFVSYTGTSTGNYQESAGSPTIGAGSSSFMPALDTLGAKRTGSADIGAYQYGATPGTWSWF